MQPGVVCGTGKVDQRGAAQGRAIDALGRITVRREDDAARVEGQDQMRLIRQQPLEAPVGGFAGALPPQGAAARQQQANAQAKPGRGKADRADPEVGRRFRRMGDQAREPGQRRDGDGRHGQRRALGQSVGGGQHGGRRCGSQTPDRQGPRQSAGQEAGRGATDGPKAKQANAPRLEIAAAEERSRHARGGSDDQGGGAKPVQAVQRRGEDDQRSHDRDGPGPMPAQGVPRLVRQGRPIGRRRN